MISNAILILRIATYVYRYVKSWRIKNDNEKSFPGKQQVKKSSMKDETIKLELINEEDNLVNALLF